jgi:hypothetical protein
VKPYHYYVAMYKIIVYSILADQRRRRCPRICEGHHANYEESQNNSTVVMQLKFSVHFIKRLRRRWHGCIKFTQTTILKPLISWHGVLI